MLRKINSVNGGGRAGRGNVGREFDGVEDEIGDLGPDTDNTLTSDNEADFEGFAYCHRVRRDGIVRNPGDR